MASGLTPAMVEELRNRINPTTGKRYTQNEIAAMFGVSRAYVSKLKMQNNHYARTPREVALQSYPWNTGERFHDAGPNRLMRDHAEFMATGGKGMSRRKLERLALFYNFLAENDYVVEFDPNIPPSEKSKEPRLSAERIPTGGFAYRQRDDSDGDLIIRVNEHTTLTDEGRMLWRYPPVRPTV